MAIEPDADPMALQRKAAAIDDLLVEHGYPRDKVDTWWNSIDPNLGGRTPMQAWRDGDHELVDRVIRDGYARSKRAWERWRSDPEAMALTDRKIAELRELYGF